MEEKREVKNIYAAIIAVIDEIAAIPKNKKGENGQFRSAEDITNALNPLFAKHGVFIRPTSIRELATETRLTKSGSNMNHIRYIVTYTLSAADGSSITAEIPTEATNSGDKGTRVSMTQAFKTLAEQIFQMPTKDMDEHDKDSEPATARPNFQQSRSGGANPGYQQPTNTRPATNAGGNSNALVQPPSSKVEMSPEEIKALGLIYQARSVTALIQNTATPLKTDVMKEFKGIKIEDIRSKGVREVNDCYALIWEEIEAYLETANSYDPPLDIPKEIPSTITGLKGLEPNQAYQFLKTLKVILEEADESLPA